MYRALTQASQLERLEERPIRYAGTGSVYANVGRSLLKHCQLDKLVLCKAGGGVLGPLRDGQLQELTRWRNGEDYDRSWLFVANKYTIFQTTGDESNFVKILVPPDGGFVNVRKNKMSTALLSKEQKQAMPQGFQVVKNPADGNCMYWALLQSSNARAQHPQLTLDDVEELRRAMVQLVDTFPLETQLTFSNIGTSNEWGNVEDLLVFSRLRRVNIFVCSAAEKVWTVVSDERLKMSCRGDNSIFLFNSGSGRGIHWEALLPNPTVNSFPRA